MVALALVVLAASTSTAQAGDCYCSCCSWCHMKECYDGKSCCDDPTCGASGVGSKCDSFEEFAEVMEAAKTVVEEVPVVEEVAVKEEVALEVEARSYSSFGYGYVPVSQGTPSWTCCTSMHSGCDELCTSPSSQCQGIADRQPAGRKTESYIQCSGGCYFKQDNFGGLKYPPSSDFTTQSGCTTWYHSGGMDVEAVKEEVEAVKEEVALEVEAEVPPGDCYCSCCSWCHMAQCYDGKSCCDDPSCGTDPTKGGSPCDSLEATLALNATRFAAVQV